jgi:hypothetical protein
VRRAAGDKGRALKDVRTIDACGGDLEQHFVGPRLGTGRSISVSSSAPSGCGATTASIEEGIALVTGAPAY